MLLFGQHPYLVPAQPPIGFGNGSGGGGGSMGKLTLSDEDREILDRLVNDGNDNKSSNYSL